MIVLEAALVAQSSLGWGNVGHVEVNTVAARKMPPEMPAFIRQAADRMGYLGPEPDRWRSTLEISLKNAQEPDHFLDMEMIEGLGPLPPGRYDFYRLLYDKRAATKDNPDAYLPERVGLQPYITMEVFGRLKAAFREYEQLRREHDPTQQAEQNIVFYAGWLGHYVADGSQPLHTTIKYDGWVGPNPNGYCTEHGIHAEFESDFVSRNIKAQDFAGMVHEAVAFKNPFEDYLNYLRQSNALVEKIYQLDKAGGFKDAGSPEAVAFTRERLAAGAQMLLNLCYTAWSLRNETPPEPTSGPPNAKQGTL